MRKMNLKRGITALALAAVMTASVLPAVPASAETVKVSEVSQLGAPANPAQPAITLSKTIVDGQATEGWEFTFTAIPADVKYTEPAYSSWDWTSEYDEASGKSVYKAVETKHDAGTLELTQSYSLGIMVFDGNDRTKPEGGSMVKDSAGKYVVSSTYKTINYFDPATATADDYTFTIDAKDLTPGTKQVVAFYYNSAAYNWDKSVASRLDDKAYAEAYAAWANAQPATGDWDYSTRPDADDYNANYNAVSKADYYIWSAPVAITIDDEAKVSTTVTSTSVDFNFGSYNTSTGYEVYRKVGKKFVKIATVSAATYTDSGLLSDTSYTYKIIPYYVDSMTNVITYGKARLINVSTKGSALNLKATVTKKNTIKLTWKKISGVKNYEVYRSNTASDPSEQDKGMWNGFKSYKKVKTLGKKKKSWTDKNVDVNESYSYIVKAVLPKGSTKGDSELIIQGSTGAALRFGAIDVKEDYTDKNGNRTITFDRVYGAAGYTIEEKVYDAAHAAWVWTPIATLGKNATKYTFAASAYTYFADATAQAANDYTYQTTRTYRITPFKSASVIGDSSTFTTTYTGGVVDKVTAKKEANGIRITWSTVQGAAYYKVFRTLSSEHINNKDIGGFENFGGNEVTEYVGITNPVKVDVAAWNTAVDADVAAYWAKYKEQKAVYDKAYEEQKAAYDAAVKDYTDGKTETYPSYADYIKVKVEDYITVKPSDYLMKSQKLDVTDGSGNPLTYYYQNYSYSRDTFTAADAATGILDYFGDDLYVGYGGKTKNYDSTVVGADGKVNVIWDYYYNPVVSEDDSVKLGKEGRPQAGVTYDYYVVAYFDAAKKVTDYSTYYSEYGDEDRYGYYWDSEAKANLPGTTSYKVIENDVLTTKYAPVSDFSILESNTTFAAYDTTVVGPHKSKEFAKIVAASLASEGGDPVYTTYASVHQQDIKNVSEYQYKGEGYTTVAVKAYGTATYTNKAAAKAPKLKSVSAASGKVTVKISSKVSNADYYKVYRSTKKKGKYTSVGVTKNAKKLKLVDKSVVKGKTYYYKVVSVVKNEANGELESKASKPKKVKAK